MISDTQSILHYADVRQIGEGGMGVVYRALDTRLDRQVALKFLPDGAAVRPDAKQRLLLEAKAAANLDHPNIGVIHGIEEADGQLFIVMALYQGQTLEERLAQQGPVGALEAAELCMQVARGLAKAHDAGVIHRDIKPANLFLTDEGLLKILDFGLVKVDTAPGLTTPGTIVGTPEYMAPEQIRGQQPDHRADLWGLGVVLYELLTGVSPFRSDGGFTATIMQVMSTEPPPLAELAASVPGTFQDVLDRTLAKDADERYASAREVAADLERVIAELGGATGRLSSASAPRRGEGAANGLVETTTPSGAAASTAAGTSSIVDLTLGAPGAPQVSALLEPVPRAPTFLGRERELAALRARLERDRIVAIRGMAGGGKSVLGARLARELYSDDQICWFTFDPIEKNTVDALFWSLAAFLAQRGEPLLWKYLQGEIEAHRPLDRTVRLNLFISSLGSTGCAFCLDDVHLVADDPEITEVLKSLQRLVAQGAEGAPVSFIFMGRDLPADLEHRAESLGGFSRPEVQGLLESHALELPSAVVDRLAERTHGNPTLLELAAGALSAMGDDHGAMTAFIESMAGKSDIRDYVMNHVYADLLPHEKAVTQALSIFRGPVRLEVAEETLAESGLDGILPCVDSLIQKAIVHETDKGEIYCHDLVREFCYRTLEGKLKRRLHAQAARYYEGAKNPLRAAHHTFEQGDPGRALSLLIENLKTIIDGGGAASLLEVLNRFDAGELDDEQQLGLVLARGEALTIRGEYRGAIKLFEHALDDVLEEEGRAELLCRLGSVSNDLGEYDRAIEYATESLESYGLVGDDAGSGAAHRVIGMAHYRLGRMAEASAAFAMGLELAERAEDVALSAYLDQYLGTVDLRQDRLDEARTRFERSRKAFRSIRDRIGEAEAIGNLAMVHGLLGNHDRELSLHHKVLEILDEVGDVRYLLILHNNMGDIEHRAGRIEEAILHYTRLVELARRVDHRPWLGAGLTGLAENHLAAGRTEEARQHAEAAHDLMSDSSLNGAVTVELAMSQRVLGDVRLAMGEPDRARSWFETSIPALEAAHEAEELEKARRGLASALAQVGASATT